MVEEQEEEEKVKCSRSRLIINLDVAGRTAEIILNILHTEDNGHN